MLLQRWAHRILVLCHNSCLCYSMKTMMKSTKSQQADVVLEAYPDVSSIILPQSRVSTLILRGKHTQRPLSLLRQSFHPVQLRRSQKSMQAETVTSILPVPCPPFPFLPAAQDTDTLFNTNMTVLPSWRGPLLLPLKA